MLERFFEWLWHVFCRIFQTCTYIAGKFFNWDPPETIEGPDTFLEIPEILKKKGFKKPMIVTDKFLTKLGMCNKLIEKLKQAGIDFIYFDDVRPNPVIQNIEDARECYVNNHCDIFVAVGGGSAIDTAKLAACRVVRPRTSLKKLLGLLRVWVRPAPTLAVPTTAGTGAEATVVAVVVDPITHEKAAVIDPAIRPRYAVLDPLLTLGLPKYMTSTTGIDALTHAIEAYIGRSATPRTDKYAEDAVKLIYENLEHAYNSGDDVTARMNMLKASFFGGMAFTEAYIGYVHAIAHTLGGIYNTPHGFANAVILPHMLEWYGPVIHHRLARLADCAGLKPADKSPAGKAKAFIESIKQMNRRMEIPDRFDMIKPEDVPMMAQRVMSEAHPIYPVPKFMNRKQCEAIFYQLMKC